MLFARVRRVVDGVVGCVVDVDHHGVLLDKADDIDDAAVKLGDGL